MMKKIGVIENINHNDFVNSLREEIDSMQFKGYKVEVQYSKDNGMYSALIIARENK